METVLLSMLEEAVSNQVSDIHMTIVNQRLHISMRGIVGMKPYLITEDLRLMSYLRYRSRMNLSSGMIPQSGQLQMTVLNQSLFLRFSYLPALDLETGVLRILNQNTNISLTNLSFLASQTAAFKRLLSRPNGLLLLSGPTGSGKTTTLYSMLDYLKIHHKRNIITLEDPIEVKKEGMIQLQVNEKQNLSYAEGLKQVLRHDPDVIMVGEIRDPETAKIVVRCAMTGHFVLSTIHAKDCEGVLARMIELDVNKTDLMQSMIGITNQRIFSSKGKRGKICVYEIMEERHLAKWKQDGYSDHETISQILNKAVEQGHITKKEAAKEANF